MKILKSYGFLWAALACFAVAQFGCASIGQTIDERPAAAKLVVQYGVLKYAEQSSTGKRAERLQGVRDIATAVKGQVGGEVVSIPLLRGFVVDKLKERNLSPADMLLATGLVDLITQELLARVGAGSLDPKQVLHVAEVMLWIVEAAELGTP